MARLKMTDQDWMKLEDICNQSTNTKLFGEYMYPDEVINEYQMTVKLRYPEYDRLIAFCNDHKLDVALLIGDLINVNFFALVEIQEQINIEKAAKEKEEKDKEEAKKEQERQEQAKREQEEQEEKLNRMVEFVNNELEANGRPKMDSTELLFLVTQFYNKEQQGAK